MTGSDGHRVRPSGRDRELEALRALVARTREGSPARALVSGPAGIGKSCLVNFLLSEHQDLCVLRASGDEAESELHFGVLAQLMFANGRFSPWAESADPIGAGVAVLDRLGVLQDEGPVGLLVDDAQLADVPSLQALTFALRRLRADRVFTIVSTRDPIALPDGLRRLLADDDTVRLPLTGLDAAGLRGLCRSMGAAELSAAALARLCAHTDGNPLHARELLEQVPSEVIADLSRPLPVPRTYARLVLGRLAACSPDARELVTAASVAGRSAPFHVVAEICGHADPLPALDEALGAGLLTEQWGATGLCLAFPHPLVRAAVYQDTGLAARNALHRRAAELADGALDRIRHRVRAATGPDAGLAGDLTGFARAEAASGRWSSAATHLLYAAGVAPSEQERAVRSAEAIGALIYAGRVEEAAELAGRLSPACPPEVRGFALGALAHVTGYYEGALPLLTKAWEACDPASHPMRATRIAEQLAVLRMMSGDAREGAEWAGRAIALSPAGGSVDIIRSTQLASLGLCGEHDRVLACHADLPPAATADAGQLDLILGRGIVRMWADHLLDALDDLEGVAGAAVGRSVPYRILALSYLGEAEYRAGRWDDALIHTEVAAALCDDADQRWFASGAHALASLVLAARGDWAAARGHISAALRHTAHIGGRIYGSYAAACLDTARKDPSAIVRSLAFLREDPRAGVANEPGILPWQDLLADALTATGDLRGAEAVLGPFEALAGERRRHSSLALAGRARGNLLAARGDAAAEEAFERGLAHAERVDLPFDRARLNLDYGIFLRRRRSRKYAAERLETAGRLFERLRAEPYLRRCERELAATGRPVTAAGSDPRSRLTSQEQAVARLVATGLSNRQVARDLVLSVKTVEYHLGHVFTKLGVTSRAALTLLVTRSDLDGGGGRRA